MRLARQAMHVLEKDRAEKRANAFPTLTITDPLARKEIDMAVEGHTTQTPHFCNPIRNGDAL